MKKTLILPLVLLLLAMAGLASAASIRQQLTAESTIEQIIKRGVLRVGMDIFQPWAMKDKNGKLIGFEIDVATRLANDLGVKVEFVPTAWSGIIPALLTGKFDVIIGGMGITPQRSLKVNFSIPYDYSGMSLVAHRTTGGRFRHACRFQPDRCAGRRQAGDDRRHRGQKIPAQGHPADVRQRDPALSGTAQRQGPCGHRQCPPAGL